MRTWTPPQNASVFFGWVRRKAVRLSRTFGLSIAALHPGRGPVWRCGDRVRIDPASLAARRIYLVVPIPSLGPFALTLPPACPHSSRLYPRARCSGEGRRFPVDLLVPHQRPGDARDLIGRRHRDEHPRLARKHPGQPRSGGRTSPDGPAHHRHRTRDQQPPHVALAHLRCPAQQRLAARGVLPGDQPEPGGEVTTPPEALHRRREGLDRRRRNRPDPRNTHQAFRLLVRVSARAEPSLQLQDLRFEAGDLLKQNAAQFADRFGQPRIRTPNRRRQSREVRRPLRRDDPRTPPDDPAAR